MNERIQALADEAEDYADGIVDQGGEFHPAYTKKFAELIVRECAEVCRNQPNMYAMKLDRDNCAIAIEEHFGVEP